MRDQLAARLLAKVLGWNDGSAWAETGPRLQTLAELKYDSYEGYRPGERFIESLAGWLWQFEPADRVVALRFVLDRLIMISREEMDHLIETVYPDIIRPDLLKRVAVKLGLPSHLVSSIAKSVEFRDLQRKTLVLGLADGARLDRLRRASPELSHEQFYVHPEVGPDSGKAMQEHLSAAVSAMGLLQPALFQHVILVDDFAGTGYTLLSKAEDGSWRGKLWKASAWLEGLKDGNIVAADATVWVLLYVASEQARLTITARLAEAGLPWTLRVAQEIDRSLCITDKATTDLAAKYFDPAVADIHVAKGQLDPHLGFGGLGLPLVLFHNTPNNSVALLWADTSELGGGGHLRPLFPRRQRHNPDRP